MTILVTSQKQQIFKGFGGSMTGSGATYALMPVSEQQNFITELFTEDGANFRVFRCWAELDGIAEFANRYKKVTADIKAAQPEALVLMGPTSAGQWSISDIDAHGKGYARMIKDLQDQHGIDIDVTGICNEPNDVPAADLVKLTKLMRSELDALGLQDVKIIAPELSNVDTKQFEIAQAYIDDGQVTGDMLGWATHAYNMGINNDMVDYYANMKTQNGSGFEWWQTESSMDGVTGDTRIASQMAHTALCDLNHWVQYWLYFKVAGNSDCTNLCEITTSGLRPMLQYYYLKQLSKAFPPGSHFRLSQSDKDMPNKDMYWLFGRKPAISAAAAARPDGKWAIALSNFTGIGVTGQWEDVILGDTYDAMTFNVTVKVAELGGEDLFFDVYISDGNNSIVLQPGQIEMTNGEMTVPIEPQQLITLISAEARIGIGRTLAHQNLSKGLRIARAGDNLRIGFDSGDHCTVKLFDSSGRLVFHTSLSGAPGMAADLRLPGIAQGIYLLETESPDSRQRHIIAVRE